MLAKTESLQEAINTLKRHRENMELELGKKNLDRLLFNLEEIALDIDGFAAKLVEVVTGEASEEKLREIFDAFQYGAMPHIQGHLETIEELLEADSQPNDTAEAIARISTP